MATESKKRRPKNAMVKVAVERKTEATKLELDYSEGWDYINLRVPKTLRKEVDEHLQSRPVRTYRTHRIMEAMLEKMAKEK